jgi:hypothetical protein
LKPDTGEHFERDGNTAQFRSQQERIDDQLCAERHHLEVKPKTLANRRCHGPFTDRGYPSRHLGQCGEEQRCGGDRPEQRESEFRTCLHRCRDRADLDESADARDDPERKIEELLHGRSVADRVRFVAELIAIAPGIGAERMGKR